ncbi:uncharacterized protein TRIVIDRAFT_46254 [Trichoderma virens Gv29-8]|uniref:CCHC-type domain-containing protein n=1 Tax=Hypocrea virens (strain Gv29-8 / FGSC 10586) TaxID=413071 RepID=G9N1C3_HYPVG|nr:uncharacterized protein TRIVIDRAFT_46254 [Trichoderma virens Gv29-8]EHK19554.1 hypothetical protein TRIVIDRAFT_46254 [Trichoderma virens Gv29-8]
MASPPASRDEFEVAVICALPLEYDAVTLLVDDWYEDGRYGRAPGDENIYKSARMGNVNIVLVGPTNVGKARAAAAAASLRSSYPNLKVLLLTGICGGVPSTEEDQELLLGDVVISKSVIQYDLGKRYDGTFQMKKGIEDSLGRARKRICDLVTHLEVDKWHEHLESQAACFLEQLQAKESSRHRRKYIYPGTASDQLFEPSYLHKHRLSTLPACTECCQSSDSICCESKDLSCEKLGCSNTHTIRRQRLESKGKLEFNKAQAPAIHFGRFGSGDTVVKSGKYRDTLAREHKITAFEMEGAGLWEEIPGVVIVKGVSDYADGHKNDSWQRFAAATAAAVTKGLLEHHIPLILDGPQNSTGHSAERVAEQQNGRHIPRDSSSRGLRCYRCDWDTHVLRDCYAHEDTVEDGREIRWDENRCLNCGEEDHYRRSCPWEDLLPRRRPGSKYMYHRR